MSPPSPEQPLIGVGPEVRTSGGAARPASSTQWSPSSRLTKSSVIESALKSKPAAHSGSTGLRMRARTWPQRSASSIRPEMASTVPEPVGPTGTKQPFPPCEETPTEAWNRPTVNGGTQTPFIPVERSCSASNASVVASIAQSRSGSLVSKPAATKRNGCTASAGSARSARATSGSIGSLRMARTPRSDRRAPMAPVPESAPTGGDRGRSLPGRTPRRGVPLTSRAG